MEKFYKDFGKRVATQRKAIGMTQRELGLAVGFKNHAGILSVEKGRARVLAHQLEKYAEALNTSCRFLLGLVEEP